MLRAYAKQAKNGHKGPCLAVALCGEAKDEIIKKCTALNVDLLVLGFGGVGGTKRFFPGSVAGKDDVIF